MTSCDIVLIKPGSQKQLYGELSDFSLTAIEPPLWGALLAAVLRDQGYRVILLDAEVENWNYEETARQAIAADPLLAAVVVSGTNPSASTMNMTGAGEILRHLREMAPDTHTLIAGLHPSALPERTLEETDADFLCQGEGITTLPLLLNALLAGTEDVSIEGLWYRHDGRIVSSPRPPLVAELDTLPMPAWDLLPMNRYRAHNWHCFDRIDQRQPYAVLYTSLGCPFRCTFCCINALFGKHTIRYRSIEAVMAEIDFLVSTYGVRNIKIMDEMFALNEKRTVALCDAIAARGYDLNFWAYARVNTVIDRMLSAMKAAGINWLAYGFESGNARVIQDVTKGYRMDQVGEVVEMTKAEDIHICANFIFGLPEDDYDSMNDTLKLMLDINAEWANIYCAMAFPGSKLYGMATEKGWTLPYSWAGYSQYGFESLPLPTRHLSGGQVLGFRDYAFDAYYRSPRYLHMIRDKFGPETAGHIEKMTETKLNRKHASY